jgi:hypothetical protein
MQYSHANWNRVHRCGTSETARAAMRDELRAGVMSPDLVHQEALSTV